MHGVPVPTPEPSTLSSTIETALILGVSVGGALIGMFGGKLGKKESATEGQATVLAGTILSDPRPLKNLVDGMNAVKDEMQEGREQRHRDSLVERDAVEANTRAVKELSEATRENTRARQQTGMTPEGEAMFRKLLRVD